MYKTERRLEVWTKGKVASYGSRLCDLHTGYGDVVPCGTVSINGVRRKVIRDTIFHKTPISDYRTTEAIFDGVTHYCQRIWLLID